MCLPFCLVVKVHVLGEEQQCSGAEENHSRINCKRHPPAANELWVGRGQGAVWNSNDNRNYSASNHLLFQVKPYIPCMKHPLAACDTQVHTHRQKRLICDTWCSVLIGTNVVFKNKHVSSSSNNNNSNNSAAASETAFLTSEVFWETQEGSWQQRP